MIGQHSKLILNNLRTSKNPRCMDYMEETDGYATNNRDWGDSQLGRCVSFGDVCECSCTGCTPGGLHNAYLLSGFRTRGTDLDKLCFRSIFSSTYRILVTMDKLIITEIKWSYIRCTKQFLGKGKK